MGRNNGLRFGEAIGNEASLGRNAARRQIDAAQRQAAAQQTQSQQMAALIQQNSRLIELGERQVALLEYLADRAYEASRVDDPDDAA